MEQILYHGSSKVIKRPVFGAGIRRSNYFDLQQNAFREDDLFIGEIVAKRMGPGDARL